MSQLDRTLGLTKRVGKVLSDHETCQARKFSMFRQRVFSLIVGHENLNSQIELSKDSLLQYLRDAGKRFFYRYDDYYCFLVLYVFCGNKRRVAICGIQKSMPRNIPASFLNLLTKRFRQKWPEVKIIYRGSNGFCRRILSWCERNQDGVRGRLP